ncbi:MAG: hypothetical protein EPN21_05080 [Methylococcaceae bacterium]|nr:MAG: hypothetical protein EPN21_05080 [Methylococcaceae bacterium]
MSARIIAFPEHRIVRRFDSPMATSPLGELMDELIEIFVAADKAAQTRKKPKAPSKKRREVKP